MEVMCQIATNQNPLPDPHAPPAAEADATVAGSTASAAGTSEPTPAPSTTPQSHAARTLTYLTDCYTRVAVEERCHPKVLIMQIVPLFRLVPSQR